MSHDRPPPVPAELAADVSRGAPEALARLGLLADAPATAAEEGVRGLPQQAAITALQDDPLVGPFDEP
eukprot:14150179-Alexandrium_andersonii.AAC.1